MSDMNVKLASYAPIFLAGFALSLCFFPFYISYLRKAHIGQFIREDGPTAHKTKSSTPTMGGVCFIVAFFIASCLSLLLVDRLNLIALAVPAVAICAGLIGLADDLAKQRHLSNVGISGWARLAVEFLLGAFLAGFLLMQGVHPEVMLGFVDGQPVFFELPIWFFFVFSAFIMAATTNSLNIHDGMDGLEAGTALQVFLALSVMCAAVGQIELTYICLAAAGSLTGFLIFNKHPAKIFMGDTGSLFIGGLMAAVVIAGKLELWFIPLSVIYILETLSVFAQVIWFKLTKPYKPENPTPEWKIIWLKLTKKLPGDGKRLLRMAPLHHHYEALAAERGITEAGVVRSFWIAQFCICALVCLVFILWLRA